MTEYITVTSEIDEATTWTIPSPLNVMVCATYHEDGTYHARCHDCGREDMPTLFNSHGTVVCIDCAAPDAGLILNDAQAAAAAGWDAQGVGCN